MLADAAFSDQAAELLLPRTKAVCFGHDVGRHEADIVPVQRILRARIAEADPQLHRTHLACVVAKKKPPAGEGERFLISNGWSDYSALSPPSAASPPSASSPSPTVGTSPS